MTEMEIKLRTRTVHETTITNLELVPANNKDVWEGFKLDLKPQLDPGLKEGDQPEGSSYEGMTVDEFAFCENGWEVEVTKQAIELLPMYNKLTDVHFYLGQFDADGTMCAIADSEMPNYGVDVAYNGWRVTVSCEEVEWGLDD